MAISVNFLLEIFFFFVAETPEGNDVKHGNGNFRLEIFFFKKADSSLPKHGIPRPKIRKFRLISIILLY